MKSEYAGCMAVSTEFTTEHNATMAKQVMVYLRATLESPFVAVAVRPESVDDDRAYIIHGEEMGQYKFIQRNNVRHIDEPYWTARGSQPLQWMIEDLLKQFENCHGELEVELVDIAVAKHRLEKSDAEFENTTINDHFDETMRTDNNRKMAFSSVSALPNFIRELTTEPVYDKTDITPSTV